MPASAEQASLRRVPVEDLREPVCLEALAYWRSKCRGAPMPAPRDIDPVEIPRLLKHVVLIDVIDGGRDFRYRLAGQESVEAHGADATGRSVTEFGKTQLGQSDRITGFYRHICARKKPCAAAGSMAHVGRGHNEFEAVYLPLSADGESVSRIFAAAAYFPRR